MTRKYRHKPTIVQAVQWDGTNMEEVEALVGEKLGDTITLPVGWWFILGKDGWFICPDSVFQDEYEPGPL